MIGCIIALYVVNLIFDVPVKILDENSDLGPIDYTALKPNYEDLGIMSLALLGIILSLVSIYKNENPKWIKHVALGLNLIWFLSYLSLII